ncbi:hypothetical protein DFH09DRAFT_370414 [Mycena vulgaris]|nr:hypothetical protein DFH09DRAFT_370414 [Mycena vulgaris]
MYRDEECDFAARSPPPCAGRTSGFCVRYISVLSRASFHGGAGRRGLACGGPLQRGALSFWAPTLRKTYAEFGVRSPSRLVARRTHAPGSGSFGGAGADVHRALPTLVHHAFIPTMYRLRLPACPSHAMLLPQLSPSINAAPSRPRIAILPTAPSVSHRSPHSCAYACPPESRSLPLETLLPISYLPCPAAFASNANPACLRGARSRVPPSICPRRIFEESENARASPPRRRGEVRPQGEEGGGKMGPGRMREVGVQERERRRPRAILARVGLDFITVREWIRQRVWRTSDSEFTGDSPFSLPSPHPLPTSIPDPSFLAPTPPQYATPTANANASEHIHTPVQTPREVY